LLDVASREAAHDASGSEPARAAPISDDVILRLERLARLEEQGILTEHEVQAQKRGLLGT
jgi:hypothetical protein